MTTHEGYGLADQRFMSTPYYNTMNSGTGWYVGGDLWSNYTMGSSSTALARENEELKGKSPTTGDDIGILLDVAEKRLLFFLNRYYYFFLLFFL